VTTASAALIVGLIGILSVGVRVGGRVGVRVGPRHARTLGPRHGHLQASLGPGAGVVGGGGWGGARGVCEGGHGDTVQTGTLR